MANITARKDVRRQEGRVLSFPVEEATTIYEGALVSVNAAGYAVNASDAANDAFVGVCHVGADNSGGADGAGEKVQVWTDGVIDCVYAGTATQANVGDLVYAVDNQTVDVVGDTTNDVLVGKIVEFVTATKVRVAITGFTS